jgi:hypothetical protein
LRAADRASTPLRTREVSAASGTCFLHSIGVLPALRYYIHIGRDKGMTGQSNMDRGAVTAFSTAVWSLDSALRTGHPGEARPDRQPEFPTFRVTRVQLLGRGLLRENLGTLPNFTNKLAMAYSSSLATPKSLISAQPSSLSAAALVACLLIASIYPLSNRLGY